MNRSDSLQIRDVRKIILSNQLLNSKNSFSNSSDLYQVIEKLGYVQIDTISVVERSHHHTLFSRMPLYKKDMLDDLLEKDKLIFEYWTHAASFLPMKDYKYSLLRKNRYSEKYKDWKDSNKQLVKYVYDRIRSQGPLQSKDFDDKKKGVSGWWNWKPSKEALEFLFHSGAIMIAKRKGFQKVFDLTENILPSDTDTALPSEINFYKHLIERSLNSFGIFREKEVMYLRSYNRLIFKKALQEMSENKIIREIKVKEFKDDVFYTSEWNLMNLNNLRTNNLIHILSPFDNLIIQRKRLRDFFDFEYQLECYLPEKKRKFGYFCLPILRGDKFIAKIDAKASRSENVFLINKLFHENIKKADLYSELIFKKTAQLAKFTNCAEIIHL